MAAVKRVISAVSGGIDSAVSTLLLKSKGYEVIGVYMQNWDVLDEKGVCSSQDDISDAEWICKKIGVPFHVVNFVKEYWLEVFSCLINDYESGLTPNPDIMCNRHIKFEAFYKHAIEELGGEAISTGHYARTTFGEYLQKFDSTEGVHLLKANDRKKDQTFFLSQISQNALQRSIFPLGCLDKSTVKKIAGEGNLTPLLKKKESMGICFIGSRNFQEFISEYINTHPGNFIDIETAKIVGKHKGIHQWTIGQRCRIGGCKEPYFVIDKDSSTQDILVYAVLYLDEECLGSARILSPGPSLHTLGVNCKNLNLDRR
ncbi:mitochondrial tRNA-specific 2-thiouridylase 1 isoform X2 [Hetaerina americana]|uniref:mitochondrial tRNA-specific 2-thiouridylase 1 isoform X2 n=1 Tax=Hetaerina americana TaxID=62018 RepID=UPI003A7F49A9